mmetsp:Transcript_2559/g.3846  ORF Transcript_2559/g.3846 Transcript_2559/m.3846 type:complete len:218 (-) Transcript_2559:561-1214(-)
MKEPSTAMFASLCASCIGISTRASSASSAASSIFLISSNLLIRPSMAWLPEPASSPHRFRRSLALSLYSCCLCNCICFSSPVLRYTFACQTGSSESSAGRFNGVSFAMSLSSILIRNGPTVSKLPVLNGPTQLLLREKPSNKVPSLEVDMSQTKNLSFSVLILQCACASLSGGSSLQRASRSGQHLPMIAPVASTRREQAAPFPQGGGDFLRKSFIY